MGKCGRLYAAAGMMLASAVIDSYLTMENFSSRGSFIEGNPVVRASVGYMGAGIGLTALKASSFVLAFYAAKKANESGTTYRGEDLLHFGSLVFLLGAYMNLFLDKYLQYGADRYLSALKW